VNDCCLIVCMILDDGDTLLKIFYISLCSILSGPGTALIKQLELKLCSDSNVQSQILTSIWLLLHYNFVCLWKHGMFRRRNTFRFSGNGVEWDIKCWSFEFEHNLDLSLLVKARPVQNLVFVLLVLGKMGEVYFDIICGFAIYSFYLWIFWIYIYLYTSFQWFYVD